MDYINEISFYGILFFILQSLYLILPIAVANMMPVFVKKVNFLNYPLDFNKKWNQKRILGSHKTWRGLIFGILGAIAAAYIQSVLYAHPSIQKISLINFTDYNWLAVGFLMGFGALIGDAVKSFFKRRKNIKPGSSWIPFDQLDFLIGGLLFLSILYTPPLEVIIFLLIAVPFLHIGFNLLGFYLKLKKNKL